MILATIVGMAENLENSRYEQDRVTETTGQIRRLLDLLVEADAHRDLRVRLADIEPAKEGKKYRDLRIRLRVIDAGLLAKLRDIEPAVDKWLGRGQS